MAPINRFHCLLASWKRRKSEPSCSAARRSHRCTRAAAARTVAGTPRAETRLRAGASLAPIRRHARQRARREVKLDGEERLCWASTRTRSELKLESSRTVTSSSSGCRESASDCLLSAEAISSSSRSTRRKRGKEGERRRTGSNGGERAVQADKERSVSVARVQGGSGLHAGSTQSSDATPVEHLYTRIRLASFVATSTMAWSVSRCGSKSCSLITPSKVCRKDGRYPRLLMRLNSSQCRSRNAELRRADRRGICNSKSRMEASRSTSTG